MVSRWISRIFYGTRYKRRYVEVKNCQDLANHQPHEWSWTSKYGPKSSRPYWCEGV